MKRALRAAIPVGAFLCLLGAAGCSARKPQPRAPAPGSPPAPIAPLPLDSAPSGVLYRIGLKSDVTDLAFGPPGARWILAAGGKRETVRGPLRFLPEGRALSLFQVQAGAFSQEGPAQDRLARLSADWQTQGSVAFSAERGVYRVLLGRFPSRAEAEAFAERLRAAGAEALPVPGAPPEGASAPATISVSGSERPARRLASPVDVYPFEEGLRIAVDGKPYRGSLRVAVNPRGTLTLVNRVDTEEYLYGVVPAEMGPKRYDAIEALKAQAVAARTYAYAHRGQFEAEGYDLCATPKCQVYAGFSAEDPLSSAAVDATRGLALASEGRFADALFVSTCGGRTEDVENVFGETPVPYLVSAECAELTTTELLGRRVPRGDAGPRSGLAWRGYVLKRHAPRQRAVRAGWLATAQEWTGVQPQVGASAAPSSLAPSAVYPSILSAFALGEARTLHLLPRDERYYGEPPAASGSLSGAAREAYDFLIRFRFGAGEPLPHADRRLSEEEYGGLLFSAALRLQGVTEASGKFLSREGANIWVKTAEGRAGLPVDPELPLARRVGDTFFPAPALTLRPGDRLRWWKRGSDVLGLWVELDAVGPAFERESAWTEWVRRVPARELARRMAGRVAGSEVKEVAITRRSAAGRATEIRVVTDVSEVTLKRFDLRQALELPEMLFSVTRARGREGEAEFVFLGRGWGHGVGLCQNGAYGMALGGATYDAILRHYYTGIEIVPAGTVAAGPPSTR